MHVAFFQLASCGLLLYTGVEHQHKGLKEWGFKLLLILVGAYGIITAIHIKGII
jgi:hypothetical protein